MAQAQMPLPVYMPGNADRKYNKSQGLCVINDEGVMTITMYSKQHAVELYELFVAGNLVALGFDYTGPATEEKTDG